MNGKGRIRTVTLEPTSGEGGVYTGVYGQERAGRECNPRPLFLLRLLRQAVRLQPECSGNLPAVPA
jgi:hypothetical protein